MTKDEIVRLFDFDRWATEQQWSVIAGLTEEQYSRDLGSSYGGIHGTLVHVYGAQRIWLARWKGESPSGLPVVAEISTRSALVDQWASYRKELDSFLQSVSDERVQQDLAFRTFKGEPSSLPLWQQMQHVVNHSTYHRGQITTMFRQIGVVPVGTDLITYYRTVAAAQSSGPR